MPRSYSINLVGDPPMAGLCRDQGKRDEAHELLAPVYCWFTEGFDTFDLKEAELRSISFCREQHASYQNRLDGVSMSKYAPFNLSSCGIASSWRARAMLSAQDGLANRP
jgi:hypothetical protein